MRTLLRASTQAADRRRPVDHQHSSAPAGSWFHGESAVQLSGGVDPACSPAGDPHCAPDEQSPAQVGATFTVGTSSRGTASALA